MYTYKAEITAVYDGDTVTAKLDLGFNIWHIIKLRLSRINTPEIRGAEKAEGKKVRDIVRSKILGKEVIIATEKDKKGKYGRYLGEIFIEGESLNQWLLENGFAKPYN